MVKIREIYESKTILVETRIANQDRLKSVLADRASRIGDAKPNSQKFITDQLYKILSRMKELYIKPYLDRNATEYDRKDAANGTLVDIDLNHETYQKIQHICDWLASAPDQTNLRGVQSLDIANAMADAYFAKKNQAADEQEDFAGIKPVFRDGPYLWVQVISKQALEREGKLMQHCVGSYYEDVQEGNCKIYSLRDGKNNPHCTIEVPGHSFFSSGTTIEQIKGKQNAAPVEKYWQTIRNFIKHMKFHPGPDAKNAGFIRLNNEWVDLDDFVKMDGLTVPYLILENSPITHLPKNLTVSQTLDLSGSRITELPENLTVGSLILYKTSITHLPSSLKVKRNLDLAFSKIQKLPENLSVGSSLDLRYTELSKLPENLSVSGNLDLDNSTIKQLPENLSVGGDLSLYDTDIKTLPKSMKIRGKIFGFAGDMSLYPQYRFAY